MLIDCFDDNNIHFLDTSIDKTKTLKNDLNFKPTYTAQYSEINSNVPFV